MLSAAAFAAGGERRRSGLTGERPGRTAAARIAVADIPAPAREGLRVGTPEPLGHERGTARWAALRRAVVARVAPSAGARAAERLSARTPEGTTNVVLVLGSASDRGGRLWIRVRLPSRRAQAGWVPRTAVGTYGVVHTRLVIDRARLTLTLYRDGRAAFRAPVGIGRSETPTPGGSFYIRDRVTRYASAFYGPVAFGTSAQSQTLTDWPAGGFVGIHGTDRPELVPGRVSHGCIRLRNADIVRLAGMLPVGTPLRIV